MSDRTLVIIDTTRIQSYIFASNRLKENIGASYLVSQVTGEWAEEILEKIAGAEKLYAGGGNFLAIFSSSGDARNFTDKLSRKVLLEAPSLSLRAVHQEISGTVKDAVQAAFRQLQTLPHAKWLSTPLLGLGVTRACTSSGFPAVTTITYGDPENKNEEVMALSADIYAKLNKPLIASANEDLRQKLDLHYDFDYPLDFDDLGRERGEHSYIAVVHADSNRMGVIIKKIAESHDIDKYQSVMREFSDLVREVTEEALKNVQEQMIQAGEYHDDKKVLYFRPLIVGGDDVTFVADGKIGIALAVAYVQAFEEAIQARSRLMEILNTIGEQNLTAAAGVALVKTHYPFARAYDLAEQLCSSAKKRSRSESCIDWHYSTTGLFGDLEEIRNREKYAIWKTPIIASDEKTRWKIEKYSMLLRPLFINRPKDDMFSWEFLKSCLHKFSQDSWSRNKLRSLYQELRNGPDAVRRFCQIYGINVSDLENLAGWQSKVMSNEHGEPGLDENGNENLIWHCLYHDALEIEEWYKDIGAPVR